MPEKDSARAWVDGNERSIELIGPVKGTPSKLFQRVLEKLAQAKRALPRIATGVTVLLGAAIMIGDILIEHRRRVRERRRRMAARPKREKSGASRPRVVK